MGDFYGYSTGILENAQLRLEYLTEAGPRIVRLFLVGGQENLLGEFPDISWKLEQGTFHILGGHRFWAAPEQPGFSYFPDSSGLVAREKSKGIELHRKPPAEGGLAKTIQINLVQDRPAVRLFQTVTNQLKRPVRIAPWGITCFPLGGTAYLPSPAAGLSPQPDDGVVLWPYSRRDDPRLKFAKSGIKVSALAGLPPLKIGAFSKEGCCAYLRAGVLLLKRFDVPQGDYADDGCNVESYCSDRLIELETLSALADLQPGESASYQETWEIYSGGEAQRKLEEIFAAG
jgi:hypothetical protein